MKRLIIFLFLFITLIFSGCNDKGTQPVDTSVIMPLKIGNFWNYNEYTFTSINDSLVSGTQNYKIVSDTIITGKKMYNVNVTQFHINYNKPYYNDEQGLWIFSDYNILQLYYKYPASVDDWFLINSDTVRIISTNKKISVPAGTFICYVYLLAYNMKVIPEKYYFFYAPGIGHIKTELYKNYFSLDSILDSSIELISYKLN